MGFMALRMRLFQIVLTSLLMPKAHGWVVCHLGNGCSATAVYDDGKSLDTLMGITPLEG